MTSRPAAGVPTLSRRARILIAAGVGLLVLLILGSQFVGAYIDWLWYGAVGYRSVYSTILVTRLAQFAVVFVFITGVLLLNLTVAYRTRPVFVPVGSSQDALARYRTAIVRRIRLVGIGVPALVGFVAALVAQGNWETVQLFFNATSFGIEDPVFGKDIGFYAFVLPFYQYLLTWGFTAVVLAFIAAAVTHYIFGGIRLAGRGAQVSGPAKAQLAVLAGIFVLFKAVDYFLDRYTLLFVQNPQLAGGITGASYTDLNAELPAKIILLVIAVICAVAFFAGAVLRNLQLPAIATVLLVLSGIIVGAVWPALLQQFSVVPNEKQREALAISRNIQATRQAYGLTDAQVNYVDYTGDKKPDDDTTRAQLADEEATISNIRVLDPSLLSQTFTQLQQRENFYGFPGKLDLDRYRVDGQLQDYVVAVRELETDQLAANQQSWINKHLVYTHGDGFVAAPADEVTGTVDPTGGGKGGFPVFTVSDTTGDGAIPVDQPRIYFGELIEHYVIVGGNPEAPPREFELDGPFTYDGSGGVQIGNWFNRLMFAAYFGSGNILLNDFVSTKSKVIFRQDPRKRVEAVAPWLTPDSDPYPAVVNGRIKWIVDAYTTLPRYPYSQRMPLGETTQDTLPGTPRLPDRQVSYVRNAVKAVVDAYSGKVTLYAWKPNDPVLQAWMNVFPGTVEPRSAISDALRQHFRYPQDLFKLQRKILTRYHVDNPEVFYSTQDFWDIPSDPTEPGEEDQPPYYVLAGPPAGDGPPSFQLTSPLTGLRRDFMAAYVSVSSKPGSYGEITVLKLPTQRQTEGPQQAFTKFRTKKEVSQDLNLLKGANTNVGYGNLLTLPTGEGTFIYVEPIYIERGNQDVSFPQLSRVLVLYGNRVGYAPSLDAALDEAVGTGPSADVTGPEQKRTAQPPSTPAPQQPPTQAQLPQELREAAAAISAALERLRQARAAGNFAAQGEALAALDRAANRYQRLAEKYGIGSGGADVTGTADGAGRAGSTGSAGPSDSTSAPASAPPGG